MYGVPRSLLGGPEFDRGAAKTNRLVVLLLLFAMTWIPRERSNGKRAKVEKGQGKGLAIIKLIGHYRLLDR